MEITVIQLKKKYPGLWKFIYEQVKANVTVQGGTGHLPVLTKTG